MTSIYEEIENSIITRLAPLASAGVDVVLLPENEADFTKPNSKPRITVMYYTSKFGGSMDSNLARLRSIGISSQEESIMLEVTMQSRKLRGTAGIMQIFEAVKDLLYGFAPADCDKLYLSEFNMLKKDKSDATWAFAATFLCSRLQAEKDSNEVVQRITKLTFDYENI